MLCHFLVLLFLLLLDPAPFDYRQYVKESDDSGADKLEHSKASAKHKNVTNESVHELDISKERYCGRLVILERDCGTV